MGRGGLRPRAPCKGHSDLDEAGKAQAEGRVHGHRAALDLVSVQAKHLQLGEVHDVHHGAEAADGELCGDKRGGGGGAGEAGIRDPDPQGSGAAPVKLLQSFRGEDGTWLGGAASSGIEVIPTGTARGQRRGQSGGLRLCLSLRFPTTPDPRITLQTPERPGVSFQRGRDLFPPVSGRGNQKVVRDQL